MILELNIYCHYVIKLILRSVLILLYYHYDYYDYYVFINVLILILHNQIIIPIIVFAR